VWHGRAKIERQMLRTLFKELKVEIFFIGKKIGYP